VLFKNTILTFTTNERKTSENLARIAGSLVKSLILYLLNRGTHTDHPTEISFEVELRDMNVSISVSPFTNEMFLYCVNSLRHCKSTFVV
jgi:hypothetical protein